MLCTALLQVVLCRVLYLLACVCFSTARGLSELYFECQDDQLVGEHAGRLLIRLIQMLLMKMIQTDFGVAVSSLKGISS